MIFFQKFIIFEVKSEVRKTTSGKSPGSTNIPIFLLKYLPNKGYRFLIIIYNTSIRLNLFIIVWKTTKIILIPKRDRELNLAASCRPISFLSSEENVALLTRPMNRSKKLFSILSQNCTLEQSSD